MKSVQNIRVVGREVANMIKLLYKQAELDPSMVHLIGHSLGAHAAGYAGKYIRGIGRITGELTCNAYLSLLIFPCEIN